MGISFKAPSWGYSNVPPTPPTSPQSSKRRWNLQSSLLPLPKLLKRVQSSPKLSQGRAGDDLFRYRESAEQCVSGTIVADDANPSSYETDLQYPSIDDGHCSKNPPPKALRRTPKSYNNLRSLSNKKLRETPATPNLLPSPICSDDDQDWNQHALFAFQNPRAMNSDSTYEDEDIVAGYCDDAPEWCGDAALKEYNSLSPRNHALRRTSKTLSPNSDSPANLRSPKRDRSSSLSSEATWLSRSFTNRDPSLGLGQLQTINMNERRLAERSRRCCHVVEGPSDKHAPSWIGERKATYATVIKPGKANGIWVPRSSSNLKSPHRSSQPSNSAEPSTPSQKASEVSAFSPWESPTDRRNSARASFERGLRKVASLGHVRHCHPDAPTRQPFPLRKSSLLPQCSREASSPSLFTSSTSSTLASQCDSVESPRSAGEYFNSATGSPWDQCEQLDELESVMNGLPCSLPQLHSPFILPFRNPNSPDELHLDLLRKIFPQAQSGHLSALAAAVVVQQFLSKQHVGLKTSKAVESSLGLLIDKLMVEIYGANDEALLRAVHCLVEMVERE